MRMCVCVLAAKRGEQEEEEAKWLEGVFIYSLPSGLLWFQGDMATLVLGPLALVWLWPASALPKPSALNFLALFCSLFRLFIVSPSVLASACTLLFHAVLSLTCPPLVLSQVLSSFSLWVR